MERADEIRAFETQAHIATTTLGHAMGRFSYAGDERTVRHAICRHCGKICSYDSSAPLLPMVSFETALAECGLCPKKR